MKTLVLLLFVATLCVVRADWPQFRGPGGTGVATAKLPKTWSDNENVLWKKALPGKGASSPVIIGKKLFITAATGGASDAERHVLCLDVDTGDTIWDKTVESSLPEQESIREEHGYASATPAANATHLFVFFGKSGAFCFDHQGKQLWNTKVGSELNGWGSAASPTLYKNTVLINACVESSTLVALDQKTGNKVWEADGIQECWHAPYLVARKDGVTEVITALAGKIRSFNADDGKPLWTCKTQIGWYMCPLPQFQGDLLYAVGGRSGVGGLAVKLGGTGDVTESHRLWTLPKGTNVPSPILHDGHLYFASENSGMAHCVDLKSGEFIYSERLDPNPDQIYASPLLVNGILFYLGRGGTMVMVKAAPKLQVIGSATLENGRGVFNATPAVHQDRIYIRSNKFLYCIGAK
jgi:outer membrane protein assembly factor BamB